MKIAVLTDVHANLPALEAALAAIRAEGCDAIFHAGDAIAIGPFPAECVELLLDTPAIHFVRGNHDAYFVDGLPSPQPIWIGSLPCTMRRCFSTGTSTTGRTCRGAPIT